MTLPKSNAMKYFLFVLCLILIGWLGAYGLSIVPQDWRGEYQFMAILSIILMGINLAVLAINHLMPEVRR